MADNNKNNGALGKALFGLGAIAISAGIAYLKGKAESDKNEVVRREQADKQEKIQHEAIVKASQSLQNTLPYEKRLILEPYSGLNTEQIREKYNAYEYKLTESYFDLDALDIMDLAMEAEEDNFESNDSELLNALGIYYDVKGKNAVKAFNCFKKAAYLSLAEACFNLGKWYLDGGDCIMAQEWFEKLNSSSNSPISESEETDEDEWDNLFDEIEEEITDTIVDDEVMKTPNVKTENEISQKESDEIISLSEQKNPIADSIIISESEIAPPIAECNTVEITESANSNSVISLDDIIRKIKNANFSDCTAYSCYIIGDLKFETKLSGAKSKYAFLNNTEKALCLLDYTLFGSAKEGFVITTENFYANFIGESIRISISDICGVKVKAKDTVNIEYIYGDNVRKYEISGLDNGKSAKFAENFYDTVSFIKDYNT